MTQITQVHLDEWKREATHYKEIMQRENYERQLALIAALEEAREALKPFHDFAPSLQEWRQGKSEWPVQHPWPDHKPILQRTWPCDEKTANVAKLFKSDFDRAAKAGGVV